MSSNAAPGPGQFNISAELLMGDGALLRGSGINTTRIVKAVGFNGAPSHSATMRIPAWSRT